MSFTALFLPHPQNEDSNPNCNRGIGDIPNCKITHRDKIGHCAIKSQTVHQITQGDRRIASPGPGGLAYLLSGQVGNSTVSQWILPPPGPQTPQKSPGTCRRRRRVFCQWTMRAKGASQGQGDQISEGARLLRTRCFVHWSSTRIIPVTTNKYV